MNVRVAVGSGNPSTENGVGKAMPQGLAGLRNLARKERGNDEGRQRNRPEADNCVSGRGLALSCLHLKET